MTYNEFKHVVDSYELTKANSAAEGVFEPIGIHIEYINANGEEKSLTLPQQMYNECRYDNDR